MKRADACVATVQSRQSELNKGAPPCRRKNFPFANRWRINQRLGRPDHPAGRASQRQRIPTLCDLEGLTPVPLAGFASWKSPEPTGLFPGLHNPVQDGMSVTTKCRPNHGNTGRFRSNCFSSS